MFNNSNYIISQYFRQIPREYIGNVLIFQFDNKVLNLNPINKVQRSCDFVVSGTYLNSQLNLYNFE